MEFVEKLLSFINSYPSWAKYSIFIGIVYVISVLLFVPRQTISEKTDMATEAKSRPFGYLPTKYLEIQGVKLFPPEPDALVQIYAIVNESKYRHPAIAGIDWLKVGPNMDKKTIELPESNRYEIRFELTKRNGKEISGNTTVVEGKPDMTSNVIRYVMNLPFAEDYKLYPVEGNVRGANVGATVSYRIYEN